MRKSMRVDTICLQFDNLFSVCNENVAVINSLSIPSQFVTKKQEIVHRQGASNIDCKADVFICFSIFDVFRFSYPASSTKYDEC